MLHMAQILVVHTTLDGRLQVAFPDFQSVQAILSAIVDYDMRASQRSMISDKKRIY